MTAWLLRQAGGFRSGLLGQEGRTGLYFLLFGNGPGAAGRTSFFGIGRGVFVTGVREAEQGSHIRGRPGAAGLLAGGFPIKGADPAVGWFERPFGVQGGFLSSRGGGARLRVRGRRGQMNFGWFGASDRRR